MSAKILFIEDNEFHREVVAEYLNSRGYETLGIPDGLNFRDYLERFEPDLILLDIKLPGDIDGFDLMEMLRRSPWHSLPVIIFSA
ncbi:MAG: response regulator, partial [Spirulinaceae cyanobacterium]